MDDTCSMMSSVYWDTTSVTSDSTIQAECFQTPMGSIMDMSIDANFDSSNISQSGNVTPINSEIINDEPKNHDLNITDVLTEQRSFDNTEITCPSRHSPIKLVKFVSVQIDSKSPHTKNWRYSFTNRLVMSKNQFRKAVSVDSSKPQTVRSILMRMRNSFVKFKPFDRSKSKEHGVKTQFSSTDRDNLEISFEKCSIQNPHNYPNSFINEDKSIFDLYSTSIHLFKSVSDEDEKPMQGISSSLMRDCVTIFVENNTKQIHTGLQFINQHLGRYFDLTSEKLQSIDKTKKFKVKELNWSRGVCIITNCHNGQRYVALKKLPPRNWISFNGFIQSNECEIDLFPELAWICYQADVITSMNAEINNCNQYSNLIMDSLLKQLIIELSHGTNGSCNDITPSNVLLIASNLSLNCVFVKSTLTTEVNEGTSDMVNTRDRHDTMSHYQKSLKELGNIVQTFLSRADNCTYFISATYPLDYMFYNLVKIRKHVNTLENNDKDKSVSTIH